MWILFFRYKKVFYPIPNFICKLFGIKQCECSNEDKVEQKGLPIINETAKQKKIRLKHKGSK